MSEGGTHGMTKRLKGYTRQKRLGTTGLAVGPRGRTAQLFNLK